jgi:DNA replication and repair protein RecF
MWMTATEAALFDGIGEASRFAVQPGQVTPV